MKITVKWKNPWLRAVVLGCALAVVLLFAGEQVRFVYQAY
jgi:hypothetical protein